jgi:uncharacterized protein YjbI with pentapeptide repeats
MSRAMSRCGLACVIALLVGAPAPATALSESTRTGAWVANELRAGHRIVLKDVTVKGPVDLGDIDKVQRLFECHGCTFENRLSAHDVIFDRTLDLSGSTFEAEVDFTGAVFHAPALFRAEVSDEGAARATRPCRFRKPTVFSLAVFDDLVSFGRTRFCAGADFRDTRFSDATFSGTWFKTAAFARASFRGAALFNDAHFDGHGSFEEADFRLRADFARARFSDGGDFHAARFGQGASFLVSKFSVKDADEAASFQDAVSSGDLNFTFATFSGEIATFSGFVSSGSLLFRDAEFDDANGMTMDQLQVRDLVLDVAAVKGISEKKQRSAVLGMIEESAKQRGDLATANDAHYKLRELRSEGYNAFWAALDYVFYRGIAGYFVRPLRPLLVLAVIATLVALVRTRAPPKASTTESAEEEPPRPRAPPESGKDQSTRPRLWRRAGRRCGTFLGCLLDTLAIAGPRWRGGGRELELYERLEVVTYRLLVVCALIGLANSNPTLREMLDSLL